MTEKRHLFLLLFTFFFLFLILKQGFKYLIAASQRLAPWKTPWRKDRAPQRQLFFLLLQTPFISAVPFLFLSRLSCGRSQVQPWVCRIPSPQPDICTQMFWPGLEGRDGLWVCSCGTVSNISVHFKKLKRTF